MRERIRVAIVCTGYIGQVHIEQLLRLPQLWIAGLVDKNRSPAWRSAQTQHNDGQESAKNSDRGHQIHLFSKG